MLVDADDIELAKATLGASEAIYRRAWRDYTTWTVIYLVASLAWIVGWVAAWWYINVVWVLIPTLPLVWLLRIPVRRAQQRWESVDAFLFGEEDEDDE
jgi:hypothetical protein